LILDRLEHALARRRREGIEVAALMLDLDGFKLINDSLGHSAGDQILLETAPRLQAGVRPNDSIGRLGGDEFVAVCELTGGAEEAAGIAERIVAAVSRPFRLDSGEHHMTASVGIALAATLEDTPESLLRDADAAMYRAKELGRGRYELFDEAMRRRVLDRLRTENELRRALERDELCVHYQPIVDVVVGQIVGVEALVRWQHPTRGLLSPAAFIPVAEETGLINDIGHRVLKQASRQVAEWQSQLRLPIALSVNVSGRQIAHPGYPEQVAEIAWRSGLLPGTLSLEITESVLIEEADAAMTAVERLRAEGLRLELDDFGTGYSSLSYLKRLTLDGLKIDRSFVQGIETDPAAGAIVEAVFQMSHAIGITVVTEGIETRPQLERLRRLGCIRAQGYLFSKPLPAAEAGKLLSRDEESVAALILG
jgi:diguanylate cyclase (GGDEF)-like protein